MDRTLRRKSALAIILVAVVFGAWFVWKSMPKSPTPPLPETPVRFASVPAIVEILSHVAHDQGFFAREGLELSMEINPDGKTSLEHLFEGSVDMAAVMGTPVVYSSFLRDDFCILARIDHPKIHWAVARKDRGIKTPGDVRGKRVAVMMGTSGHFFMDSWLMLHGLRPADVEIVNMNGPASVRAIEAGDVDAMFCWFPFPKMVEMALGENGLVLPGENLVPGSWVVVASRRFVADHPEAVRGFLRALLRARAFVAEHPDEAMRIHAATAGVDEAVVATIFDRMDLRPLMDQALLLDLEDQARWIMNSGYTNGTTMPDFLSYLHPRALREVDPNAVTLIGGDADDD